MMAWDSGWIQALAVVASVVFTAVVGGFGVCYAVKLQVQKNAQALDSVRGVVVEVKEELDEHVKESVEVRKDVAVLQADVRSVHKRLDRMNGVK